MAITADACYTRENMDRDVLPTIALGHGGDVALPGGAAPPARRAGRAGSSATIPAQWAATPQAPAVFA